jgi:hypothetical protein
VGNNWNAAVSMLKQDYKEGETSLQDALDLAIKVGFDHSMLYFLVRACISIIFLSADPKTENISK